MLYGYGLLILGLVISLAASWHVKATFRRYSKEKNVRGLTGAQTARMILDGHGLYHVGVERISGKLTDHFDPAANVVRLSNSTYDSDSVAAVGVAAHECGHAVQYAEEYGPMSTRTAVLRVSQIGSQFWYLIFVVGIFLGSSLLGETLQIIGIVLFSLIVLFQLVTLPVEFNASSRAMETMESRYILSDDELGKARKVLTAAALTYVAALVTALLQLLRLIRIARGGRR